MNFRMSACRTKVRRNVFRVRDINPIYIVGDVANRIGVEMPKAVMDEAIGGCGASGRGVSHECQVGTRRSWGRPTLVAIEINSIDASFGGELGLGGFCA